MIRELREPSRPALTLRSQATAPETRISDLGRLDLLGRMPIPLRRPFKAGLDRAVAAHQAATGTRLECCFLSGSEWYRPFDGLAAAPPDTGLPGMLVSHLYHDILTPNLLDRYRPVGHPRTRSDWHPVCKAAGLADPLGVFQTFAVIPFVFLVDAQRLKGRPAPLSWSDLLDPCWADEIVFGGWRPNDQVPYQDYNSYLLYALHQEYGSAGLSAFAANVRHLQHNIRTATQAGSNSRNLGAIAILPWLQADLCPRRERTRVVWPADGALAMPIGYLLQASAAARLAPLVNYVTGPALGAVLARNCYPPVAANLAGTFPPGARLKWPGWDQIRDQDLAVAGRQAGECFFAAWSGDATRREGVRACS